jgi:hypothetical protein
MEFVFIRLLLHTYKELIPGVMPCIFETSCTYHMQHKLNTASAVTVRGDVIKFFVKILFFALYPMFS